MHHRYQQVVTRIIPCSRVSVLLAASLFLGVAMLVLTGCASSPRAADVTATPVPTPIIEGPLAGVVRPVVGTQAQRVATSYDASTQQAKITLTVGAAPDVTTAQARVKALCFTVEKALWASNPSLREVKVIVLGPILDDYGDAINAVYGVSDVFAPTAARLQWKSLSPERAWDRYDGTWLRPTYRSNWIYGKNN